MAQLISEKVTPGGMAGGGVCPFRNRRRQPRLLPVESDIADASLSPKARGMSHPKNQNFGRN
ncbi:MAG: hypothetical protein ACRD5R_18490, partial [Candidatus Acidiferrales bacterium]